MAVAQVKSNRGSSQKSNQTGAKKTILESSPKSSEKFDLKRNTSLAVAALAPFWVASLWSRHEIFSKHFHADDSLRSKFIKIFSDLNPYIEITFAALNSFVALINDNMLRFAGFNLIAVARALMLPSMIDLTKVDERHKELESAIDKSNDLAEQEILRKEYEAVSVKGEKLHAFENMIDSVFIMSAFAALAGNKLAKVGYGASWAKGANSPKFKLLHTNGTNWKEIVNGVNGGPGLAEVVKHNMIAETRHVLAALKNTPKTLLQTPGIISESIKNAISSSSAKNKNLFQRFEEPIMKSDLPAMMYALVVLARSLAPAILGSLALFNPFTKVFDSENRFSQEENEFETKDLNLQKAKQTANNILGIGQVIAGPAAIFTKFKDFQWLPMLVYRLAGGVYFTGGIAPFIQKSNAVFDNFYKVFTPMLLVKIGLAIQMITFAIKPKTLNKSH